MGTEHTCTMGRMHSKGKGIARRSLPYKRTAPSWVKQSASDCVKEICTMAKKGFTPSQIGVVLRDSHGIPQVKKAVAVRKHLEKNRKDRDSKFRLILIESRIHRLARYYKLAKRIPGNWRYESANAAALLV